MLMVSRLFSSARRRSTGLELGTMTPLDVTAHLPDMKASRDMVGLCGIEVEVDDGDDQSSIVDRWYELYYYNISVPDNIIYDDGGEVIVITPSSSQ